SAPPGSPTKPASRARRPASTLPRPSLPRQHPAAPSTALSPLDSLCSPPPPRALPPPEADALRSRIQPALNGRLMALAERIDPSIPPPPATMDDELEASIRLLTEHSLAGASRPEVESYERVARLLRDLERMLAPATAT